MKKLRKLTTKRKCSTERSRSELKKSKKGSAPKVFNSIKLNFNFLKFTVKINDTLYKLISEEMEKNFRKLCIDE